MPDSNILHPNAVTSNSRLTTAYLRRYFNMLGNSWNISQTSIRQGMLARMLLFNLRGKATELLGSLYRFSSSCCQQRNAKSLKIDCIYIFGVIGGLLV